MSGDGTRRGPGPLVIAAVFLGIVTAGYLAIELVQRHRFKVLEAEAHAVVLDFTSSVRFQVDENKRLLVFPLSDSRGLNPVVSDVHWEEVGERGTSWFMVVPLYSVSTSGLKNPYIVVFVDQRRTIILGSPKLQINLEQSHGTTVPPELDARLKARALSYGIYHSQ